MRLGVIADDFTGASDIALTLAEGGMVTGQLIGVPDGGAPDGLDAAVVALKSRTAPLDVAIRDSLAACEWLRSQGAEQIVFKVCSTFDSTANGNIGPVLDALSDHLMATGVIVCPAFPENGRSVYQGHLFVQDRLLNESGMQDHPLTPMKDADLRRVLAAQSVKPVGHVNAMTVMHGPDAIRAALPHEGHAIVDAVRDADLLSIGSAAKDAPLLCGGSGIAQGLPANFGFSPAEPGWQAIVGPGIVLSGSCSRTTREQVETYKTRAPHHEITALDAVEGTTDIPALVNWTLAQGQPPLIYSSADPAIVAEAQTRFGSGRAAHAIETLFAELAARLTDRGVTRIVVAGGETSGAVVEGLQAQMLEIGPRLAPGVPVLRKPGKRPIALALKSGNFGDREFFARALARMEQQI